MQFNIKLMMILISIGIQALRVVFLITSSDQKTSSPVQFDIKMLTLVKKSKTNYFYHVTQRQSL